MCDICSWDACTGAMRYIFSFFIIISFYNWPMWGSILILDNSSSSLPYICNFSYFNRITSWIHTVLLTLFILCNGSRVFLIWDVLSSLFFNIYLLKPNRSSQVNIDHNRPTRSLPLRCEIAEKRDWQNLQDQSCSSYVSRLCPGYVISLSTQ